MITGIAHICLLTADLERALKFYHEQLGLPLAFEFRKDEGQRYGVYLKAGNRTFVEIFCGQLQERAYGQHYQHFCLEVDDIDQTVATLRERGVEVSDPMLGLDQTWQAWINDPDGNRIELHAYGDKSWQMPHLA